MAHERQEAKQDARTRPHQLGTEHRHLDLLLARKPCLAQDGFRDRQRSAIGKPLTHGVQTGGLEHQGVKTVSRGVNAFDE
jgi:hypothetical protein